MEARMLLICLLKIGKKCHICGTHTWVMRRELIGWPPQMISLPLYWSPSDPHKRTLATNRCTDFWTTHRHASPLCINTPLAPYKASPKRIHANFLSTIPSLRICPRSLAFHHWQRQPSKQIPIYLSSEGTLIYTITTYLPNAHTSLPSIHPSIHSSDLTKVRKKSMNLLYKNGRFYPTSRSRLVSNRLSMCRLTTCANFGRPASWYPVERRHVIRRLRRFAFSNVSDVEVPTG